MLWYDTFSLKNSIVFTKNVNKNIILFKRSTNYFLPSNWKLIIFYKNYHKPKIYLKIYSNIYYLYIPLFLNVGTIKYDFNTKQIIILNHYRNVYIQTYLRSVKKIFNMLIKPYFVKLNFKGKGYYIYKNSRNTITPQFGYSHRLYLYSFINYVNFLNKSSLLVFGLNPSTIRTTCSKIRTWRNVNLFTMRGVRFSKQIIYKKSGKISTYR